jgi:hypothetical protein
LNVIISIPIIDENIMYAVLNQIGYDIRHKHKLIGDRIMIQILIRRTTKPFYVKEDGQCLGRGLAADMLAPRGFQNY